MSTPQSVPLSLFDWIALFVCIGVLLLYHAYFYFHTLGVNESLQLSFNLRNVAHWVHKQRENSDAQSRTLVVQTLRNTIMVGVFVGGYALTFAYEVVSSYSPETTERIHVRSIILSVLLFASFLCWSNVIRHAVHLGYLIGTLGYEDKSDLEVRERLKKLEEQSKGNRPPNSDDSETESKPVDLESGGVPISDRSRRRVELYEADLTVSVKKAEHIMQRMLLYFSLGFRCLFVAIPFAFYITGPLGLAIATGVILVFSYNYDFHSFGEVPKKGR